MNKFRGPLFIVGRPRSGTKLLRTLLNEHPQIAIPISETNFIPAMIAHFGDPPRLHLEHRLDEFYCRFRRTYFFDYRRKQGYVLEKYRLAELANLTSWSSIFETILKYYAPKEIDSKVIWGDKSPSYLTHIPLLKSLFPKAKFLHIIRDPRDQCLSVERAWGKSLKRSADVWRKEVQNARDVGQQLESDYMEIRFEALLSNPESALQNICEFLEIDFSPAMVQPSVSHEDRGDAAGELTIVRGNQRKYLEVLSPKTLTRIEEITFPVAVALGYTPHVAVRFRPLNAIERRALALQDGLSMTKFYIQDKGIHRGMRFLLRKLIRSEKLSTKFNEVPPGGRQADDAIELTKVEE